MKSPEKTAREKALEMYLEHSGDITNRAIAKKLEVNEKTLSVWKHRDRWKEQLKCSTQDKRATTSKNMSLRDQQREKVIDALKVANSYSPALFLLIDVYLDCFEEYEDAKEKGLETEALRKEIARLLRNLGLDTSNKYMKIKNIEKENNQQQTKKEEPGNKLLQFRRQVSK